MTSVAEQSESPRIDLSNLSLRSIGWTLPLAITVFVTAAVLRLWDLDHRALHHDESLHAYFSWRFSEFFEYDHNPLMHGPFQFHIVGAAFTVFGDSDFTARLPAALFGSALVLMPFLLRDCLGRAGWLATSVLIAVSPTLLYFSRFARGDIFVAVWTLAMVICIWRYMREQRPSYLVALALFLGLSFATKETTFITALLFIAYLNVMVGLELWSRWSGKPDGPVKRFGVAAALVLGAWAAAALWPFLRGLRDRRSLGDLPIAAAPLLVLGLLTAPQFAAAAQVPLEGLGLNLATVWTDFAGHDMTTEIFVGIISVGLLLGLTFAAGFAWDWRLWLLVVAAFYLPYIALFTTLGSEQDGFASGIWGSLDYWLAQQDVQRGNQPWFYYLMTVPVYEFASLIFALIGGWYAIRHGDAFGRFLVFWFAGTLLALSLAGEKMPWLTVHLALPLALIAGRYLGSLIEGLLTVDFSSRIAGFASAAGVAVAVFLLALSARTGLVASFEHSDEPYELLVYVQTTQELKSVSELIDQEAEASGLGTNLPIVVDSSDGFTWP
ncbi:MAG TPA: flippase activity-associated protein Agl23, partial [Dehalococcoidia bacterium]|nr:flippase activity-associated protein Agl23 [Dehalococcoidia bacterium]